LKAKGSFNNPGNAYSGGNVNSKWSRKLHDPISEMGQTEITCVACSIVVWSENEKKIAIWGRAFMSEEQLLKKA
jgi:hypothetical protein